MTTTAPGAARPIRRGLGDAIRRVMPRRDDYKDFSRTWKADLVAGLTVGVVALPLALAFGITTGLGAAAGLTTAIVAGLVAAVFGGSNVQVSGPTGAMTVVLVPLVARHGTDAVVVVGILAGILVTVAGVLRLGRVVSYIPWPVIEGFTLGIAVIIFLQQVPAALGVSTPEGENTAAVAFAAVIDAITDGSLAALGLVALVAVVMAVGPRLHRSLPASLVAVVLATVVASVAGWDVATIGALPSSLPLPSMPDIPFSELDRYLSAAFAVAALAAIESLLSAKVADGMSDTSRHDPDRELFGQGLANVASTVFGGMPATGAIARTAVNVRAGARSRFAAVVHSLVLVVVVLVGSGLVARIPLAALAGVLMVTAVRMVETHNVRSILRSTRQDAFVLVLTAVATVAFDLILAVQIGVAVAAVLALVSVARTTAVTRTTIDLEDPDAGEPEVLDAAEGRELLRDHIVTYRVDGALFFGAAQRFLAALSHVADVRVVILRLPQVKVLDATGAQAIREIIDDLEHRGITVLVKGARPEHLRVLEAVGALDRLTRDGHVFADLSDAVAHAREHVAGEVTHPGGP
ncbi:MAG TPA: SulP family inorganic anion transporter [Microthrixaceae bacterium]|nr:SulP family inorganic anion transporter [Microthrixaceae bacterium]